MRVRSHASVGVLFVLVAVLTGVVGVTPVHAAGATTTTGGQRRKCTVVGTAAADRLRGTSSNDVICGLGGNDIISGLGGSDVIDGGLGNDIIDGGSSNDVIAGNGGNDTIEGGSGNDTITGHDGIDKMLAGAGDDSVNGGSGNDKVLAGAGNDVVNGGSGNDRLDGGDDDDLIIGGPGVDDIDGGTGINDCRRDAGDTASCTDTEAPVAHLETLQVTGQTKLDNLTGHNVRMTVRATDDRSGIRWVWADFFNEKNQYAFSAGQSSPPQKGRLASGTVYDGVWNLDGYFSPYTKPGTYQIKLVTVQDRVGRRTSYEVDRPDMRFVVTGEDDTTAPVIDDASAAWITPTTIDNNEKAMLRIRIRLTDAESGVNTFGQIRLSSESGAGQMIYVNQHQLASGTPRDGVWEFVGYLPAHTAAGQWAGYVKIADMAGNPASSYLAIPPLTVTGASADIEPPAAALATAQWVTPTVVNNGTRGTARLRMSLTDDAAGISTSDVIMCNSDDPNLQYTGSSDRISGSDTDGVWEFAVNIPVGAPTGTWHACSLWIFDHAGRVVQLDNLPQIPALTVTTG